MISWEKEFVDQQNTLPHLVPISFLYQYFQTMVPCNSMLTGFILKEAWKLWTALPIHRKGRPFPPSNPIPPPCTQVTCSAPGDTAWDWHETPGHPGNYRLLSTIHQWNCVPNLSQSHVQKIHSTPWLEARTRRAPLQRPSSPATTPLELTHTDFTVPINPPSSQESKYMQVLFDNHRTASSIYFLSNKSQVLVSIKWYKSFEENE